MHALAHRAALISVLLLRQLGLGPHVTPELSQAQLVQLWEEPGDLEERDLLAGPSIGISAPDITQPFTFDSQKTTGFSPGYDVKDAAGREWSVKLGPEAQTEVVASRLLWAIGYHQPPIYYVDQWMLMGGPSPGIQSGARFRSKDGPLKSDGIWSWQHNPFVDTQPYRGLIVVMLLLNSTDLRNENNVVYKVRTSGGEPAYWFVVKDLGATFGATGVYRPVRNDLDAFEREPFLTMDEHGHARFAYRGLHKELLAQISGVDVKWTCDLLGRLAERQWRDAFRSGGYSDEASMRYIAALQERLRAARALADTLSGDESDYWANRRLRQAVGVVQPAPKDVHPARTSVRGGRRW
jgi:hypothetical protein